MNTFLGVNFLKIEYITSNGGRIDSLGIDENDYLIIFYYKTASNENTINRDT
ncbi:hypothetical protein [Clostridium sp.]|uniref:hypothetical protein n=1 Tax=Clostridium sp. TaxID=1506 RepID=UPI003217D142